MKLDQIIIKNDVLKKKTSVFRSLLKSFKLIVFDDSIKKANNKKRIWKFSISTAANRTQCNGKHFQLVANNNIMAALLY